MGDSNGLKFAYCRSIKEVGEVCQSSPRIEGKNKEEERGGGAELMCEMPQEGGVPLSMRIHSLDFKATDHTEEKACCRQEDQSNAITGQ